MKANFFKILLLTLSIHTSIVSSPFLFGARKNISRLGMPGYQQKRTVGGVAEAAAASWAAYTAASAAVIGAYTAYDRMTSSNDRIVPDTPTPQQAPTNTNTGQQATADTPAVQQASSYRTEERFQPTRDEYPTDYQGAARESRSNIQYERDSTHYKNGNLRTFKKGTNPNDTWMFKLELPGYTYEDPGILREAGLRHFNSCEDFLQARKELFKKPGMIERFALYPHPQSLALLNKTTVVLPTSTPTQTGNLPVPTPFPTPVPDKECFPPVTPVKPQAECFPPVPQVEPQGGCLQPVPQVEQPKRSPGSILGLPRGTWSDLFNNQEGGTPPRSAKTIVSDLSRILTKDDQRPALPSKFRPNISATENAQAPGKPTKEDGYQPPKKWDGEKVKHEDTGKYGYPDKDGKVWVPSGPKGHGGPHWDVQKPGKGYDNVYPGGTVRPGKD